jgi:hypothetical protein
MVSSSQIRKQIARYINREIDLNALQLWLVQNTANADFGGSAAAENLIYSIHRVLSEYSDKYSSGSDVRRELIGLVQRDNVRVPVVGVSRTAASSPVAFIHSSQPLEGYGLAPLHQG